MAGGDCCRSRLTPVKYILARCLGSRLIHCALIGSIRRSCRRHKCAVCKWSSLCAPEQVEMGCETEYVCQGIGESTRAKQQQHAPDDMRAKTKYFMWMWKTQHKHINIFAAITNNELITIRRGFNISAFEMRKCYGKFQQRLRLKQIDALTYGCIWQFWQLPNTIRDWHKSHALLLLRFFSSKWQSKFSTRFSLTLSLSLSLCSVQSVRSMIGVTRWI